MLKHIIVVFLFFAFFCLTASAQQKDEEKIDPARVPKIVSIFPKSGANGVDASVPFVLVAFDIPMSEGFSFATRGDTGTPGDPEDEKIRWSEDGKVCIKPVLLEPNKKYEHLMNFPPFVGFHSKDGVATEKFYYSFSTGPKPVDKTRREALKKEFSKKIELMSKPPIDDKGKPVDPKRVPKVLEISPKNGAKDVDPATAEIRITFDIPMGDGFAFGARGDSGTPGDPEKKPFWSEDGRTCIRPVKLEPGKKYEHLINFPPFVGFASVFGVPAPKLHYSFSTAEKP